MASLGAQLKAAQGVNRNLAQGFLEFSRAAEDAQYGIAGVVNNIPGMVTAMGGGAGLTAAISLGAVAVAQFVKHWDDIKSLFSDGLDAKAIDDVTRPPRGPQGADR